jgi:adenylosuccinate lyase
LDELVTEKAAFSSAYIVSSQMYPRKIDLGLLNSLGGLGATPERIATDIRLLAHDKELEEPFEKDQIGICCVMD